MIRTASFIGNSLPNFFVSLLLMYVFAIRLNWFPVISRGVSLQSVALPSLTLAIAMSAKYLRQVRATVLDELSKDYVLGAKARGVKFSTTMMRSVMKASLVTIITLLTLSIGSLLGGTAIVESTSCGTASARWPWMPSICETIPSFRPMSCGWL